MKLPTNLHIMYIYLNVYKQMTNVRLWLLHSNTWNYLNVYKQMTDVKLLLLHNNTWNRLTVCKKWAQARLQMLPTKVIFNIYV